MPRTRERQTNVGREDKSLEFLNRRNAARDELLRLSQNSFSSDNHDLAKTAVEQYLTTTKILDTSFSIFSIDDYKNNPIQSYRKHLVTAAKKKYSEVGCDVTHDDFIEVLDAYCKLQAYFFDFIDTDYKINQFIDELYQQIGVEIVPKPVKLHLSLKDLRNFITIDKKAVAEEKSTARFIFQTHFTTGIVPQIKRAYLVDKEELNEKKNIAECKQINLYLDQIKETTAILDWEEKLEKILNPETYPDADQVIFFEMETDQYRAKNFSLRNESVRQRAFNEDQEQKQKQPASKNDPLDPNYEEDEKKAYAYANRVKQRSIRKRDAQTDEMWADRENKLYLEDTGSLAFEEMIENHTQVLGILKERVNFHDNTLLNFYFFLIELKGSADKILDILDIGQADQNPTKNPELTGLIFKIYQANREMKIKDLLALPLARLLVLSTDSNSKPKSQTEINIELDSENDAQLHKTLESIFDKYAETYRYYEIIFFANKHLTIKGDFMVVLKSLELKWEDYLEKPSLNLASQLFTIKDVKHLIAQLETNIDSSSPTQKKVFTRLLAHGINTTEELINFLLPQYKNKLINDSNLRDLKSRDLESAIETAEDLYGFVGPDNERLNRERNYIWEEKAKKIKEEFYQILNKKPTRLKTLLEAKEKFIEYQAARSRTLLGTQFNLANSEIKMGNALTEKVAKANKGKWVHDPRLNITPVSKEHLVELSKQE